LSLQHLLDETAKSVRSALPADIFGAIGRSISDLKQTGQDRRAAGVGTSPDLPTLPGLDGVPIDLKALVSKGPLVLTFYRGGWCPYCNVALRAFAERYPEFVAAGASVVAITPERQEKAEATSGKTEVPFPIAIDASNAFARKLGLAFSLPNDLRPLYRRTA
jgi:peroxiredoxin